MKQTLSVLACVAAVLLMVTGCGKGSGDGNNVELDDVFANMNPAKNTKLHSTEYWKGVEGKDVKSSANVVGVQGRRNYAEILVLRRNDTPSNGKHNMVLLVPDIAKAAELKVGQSIRFTGTLSEYRITHGDNVIITIKNASM